MAVSKKAWVGFAFETTSGTPITPPTTLHPAKATHKGKKNPYYDQEDRGTRDKDYGRTATTRDGTLSLQGKWFNDSSAKLLYAAMGADTPSQPSVGTDPTVWSHALTLADVPPSLTTYRVLDTAAAYQFVYSVVSGFKINWEANAGKVVEGQFDLATRYPAKVSAPTKPATSIIKAFPGYAPTINLNGTQSADMQKFEIDFSQDIKEWWGSGNTAGADYTTAYFGSRELTMSFEARFDASTLHDAFDADTDYHVVLTLLGDVISNTYKQQVAFDFPIFAIDELDVDTGSTNIIVKGKGKARAGATANSLFTATVQNTLSVLNS